MAENSGIEMNSSEYRAGFEAGFCAGQALPESSAGAMLKIMRRIGIVGATYGEIADQVCKRLDGCEAVIGALKRQNALGGRTVRDGR